MGYYFYSLRLIGGDIKMEGVDLRLYSPQLELHKINLASNAKYTDLENDKKKFEFSMSIAVSQCTQALEMANFFAYFLCQI